MRICIRRAHSMKGKRNKWKKNTTSIRQEQREAHSFVRSFVARNKKK